MAADPLHIAIMRHCLQLTLSCPISQTAFCVGSTLLLSASSPLFPSLRSHYPTFPPDDPNPAGLILGDGYSRQIPGNTHAEANALANFRSRHAELSSSTELPSAGNALKEAECYATMEPCSVRTVYLVSLHSFSPRYLERECQCSYENHDQC